MWAPFQSTVRAPSITACTCATVHRLHHRELGLPYSTSNPAGAASLSKPSSLGPGECRTCAPPAVPGRQAAHKCVTQSGGWPREVPWFGAPVNSASLIVSAICWSTENGPTSSWTVLRARAWLMRSGTQRAAACSPLGGPVLQHETPTASPPGRQCKACSSPHHVHRENCAYNKKLHDTEFLKPKVVRSVFAVWRIQSTTAHNADN